MPEQPERLYHGDFDTDEESVAELVEELRSTISHARDHGADRLEVTVRE